MDISELLERACARLSISSDRALERALGMTNGTLTSYRRGIKIPTDDRMIRICDVSGIAPERGLLMLNMWRTSGAAHATYSRMLKIWDENAPAPVKNRTAKTKEERLNL